MEQNKLPKNIRQIGDNETWIRVYMEDYVHTYIQRLKDMEDGKIAGGILLGKKQRINGVMHLFIRGAVVAEDPMWKKKGQTPKQLKAEGSVYFPDQEVCGFFVSSKQSINSEVELSRIFESHFSKEYQILFEINDNEDVVYAWSGHGMGKLSGHYIYYEKNEEMQAYIMRQESLRAINKRREDKEEPENKGENGRIVTVGENMKKEKLLKQNESRGGKNMAAGNNNDNEQGGKKKLSKVEIAVRGASVAGIFLLAFLLFSDQIKLLKKNVNNSDIEAVNGTVEETGMLPVGADSNILESTTGESLLQTDSSESDESESSSAEGANASGENLESTQESRDSNAALESSDSESSKEAGITESKEESDSENKESSGDESSKSSNASGSVSTLENADKSNENAESDSSKSDESKSDESKTVSIQTTFPMQYLVKKGDSIYEISKRYYGNTDMVDAICFANGITNPEKLKYGEVITLPKK